MPKEPLPSFHSLPSWRWQMAIRSGMMDQSLFQKLLEADDLRTHDLALASDHVGPCQATSTGYGASSMTDQTCLQAQHEAYKASCAMTARCRLHQADDD